MQWRSTVGVDLAAARGEDPRTAIRRECRDGLEYAVHAVEVGRCRAIGVCEHRPDSDPRSQAHERVHVVAPEPPDNLS